jgi:peptidoglycan hydrolase-like protein with peptidoglycan-binding domain
VLNNDLTQVAALQTLLNRLDNAKLIVSGNYDLATENAVKEFQTKHSADILAPWGTIQATGVVSVTTRHELNNLNCNSTQPLTLADTTYISNYENNLALVTNVSANTNNTNTATQPITTISSVDQNTATATDATTSTLTQNPSSANVLSAFSGIGGFFSRIFHTIF